MSITLYRGDNTSVTSFKFNKTHYTGLCGPGVYLTDDKEIAQAYRMKVDHRKRRKSLKEIGPSGLELMSIQKASNKQQAYNEICRVLVDKKQRKNRSSPNFDVIQELDPMGRFVGMEPSFVLHYVLEMVRSKLIHVEPQFTGNNKFFEVYVDCGPPACGQLSVFHFDLIDFESSMIVTTDISRGEASVLRRHGVRLTRGLYGLRLATMGLCFEQPDVTHMKSKSRSNLKKQADPLIDELQSLGYRGFEYPGGSFMGNKKHRAFVVWDEEYINQHRQG